MGSIRREISEVAVKSVGAVRREAGGETKAAGPKMAADRLVKSTDPDAAKEAKYVAAYFRAPKVAARRAEVASANMPIYHANKAYVDKILAGLPGDNATLLQEVLTHTDPTSGMHKLARAVEQAGPSFFPTARRYLLAANGKSDQEIAQMMAGVSAETVSFQNAPQLLGAVRAMPGLTAGGQHMLAKADADFTAFLQGPAKTIPAYEPGPIARFFGAKPIPAKVVHAGPDYYRSDAAAGKVKTAFLGVNGIPVVGVKPALDVAARQQLAFRRTLEENIRSGKWQVFRPEDYKHFHATSAGQSSGIASTEASSFVQRSLLQRAEDGSSRTVASGASSSVADGQVVSSIGLPIPGTGVNAPLVSAQTVLTTPGEFYVRTADGKIRAIHSQNAAEWMDLARRGVKAAAH